MYGGMLKSCVSKDEGVEMDDDDVEKENELGNVDLNYKAQNGQHLNKIVKLQKAVDSPVQDWDEFDNVPSIEKLKKNLQHSPQNDKYKNLQVEYQEAVKTAQEQKQLITQLEEDLRSVNALSSMFRGTPEGQNVLTPGGEAEMVAEVVKDVATPVAITIDPSSKTAADSLLPIIQSQRERYRLRAQDLEAQTLGQQQQVSLLQNEIDKLRSDNVKLYEKIRFLQSYPQGRFILGNKTARTVAFFYTLLLHTLIFLVLYKLAHTESCKRDMAADWHEKYADHMMKVHGHQDKHG